MKIILITNEMADSTLILGCFSVDKLDQSIYNLPCEDWGVYKKYEIGSISSINTFNTIYLYELSVEKSTKGMVREFLDSMEGLGYNRLEDINEEPSDEKQYQFERESNIRN